MIGIGTIEERKRMVAPFAQRTSSENNIGDRLRRSFLRFGYSVSFQALDKGAIEILGPYGISYTFRRLAERISQLQSGFVVRRVRYEPWPPARARYGNTVLTGWWGLAVYFRAFTAPFCDFPSFVRPRGSQKRERDGYNAGVVAVVCHEVPMDKGTRIPIHSVITVTTSFLSLPNYMFSESKSTCGKSARVDARLQYRFNCFEIRKSKRLLIGYWPDRPEYLRLVVHESGCNQTSKKRKKGRPLAAAASPGLGPQKIPPLSGRHSSHPHSPIQEPSLMFPIEGRVDESLGGRGSLGPKVLSSSSKYDSSIFQSSGSPRKIRDIRKPPKYHPSPSRLKRQRKAFFRNI
ncbi:hypothetical protein M5K25_028226 [Dendrobium thyrsiflorum]|uniref:NADH-ubiquinone oxidoreductase chain 5 n=1 Tax=Dendrobium thyrsiflorum TaxID=117978 RepID=A0ABD0TTT4_DENTH